VQDFYQTESHLLHVALPRPHEPRIDEAQEHHVIRYLHAVPQEVTELAPRRVGDDPVHRGHPLHEVRSFVDFALLTLAVESADECFPTRARFEDSTAWAEVIHDQACRVVGGVDSIITTLWGKRTGRPNKTLVSNGSPLCIGFLGWFHG
jgi:hypothetical protein